MANSKEALLTFTPTNDWRDEDQRLYDDKELTIFFGDIICFTGCNGAGKTTLLEQIEQELKNVKQYVDIDTLEGRFFNIFAVDDIEYCGYIVKFDKAFDIRETKDFDNIFYDINLRAHSTGENLICRFNNSMTFIKKYMKKAKDERKPIVFLYDDCDVGSSLDVQDDIIDFINELHDALDEKDVKHAIICTANSYELAKAFTSIDCNTLEQNAFSSYEEYHDYVNKSRKRKNARYNVD